MLQALKRYAGIQQSQDKHESSISMPVYIGAYDAKTPPIVWKGTADEYHSLLALRQAELILAKSQLTGNPNIDWYINNRIRDLEIKISDMKRWMEETKGGNRDDTSDHKFGESYG